MKLNSMDLSDHVALRKTYCPKVQVGPVVPSTILHELLQIRSVLTHASVMWETPVDLNAFDRTTAQLRKTRQISASRVSDRLPTNDELKQLIVHFHEKWESRGFKRYPMHLIIRLAEKRLYYSTDPAMQFARFMAKSATLCLIKEKPH